MLTQVLRLPAPHSHPRMSAWQRAVVLLAMVASLLVQTLGVLHGVAHPARQAVGHVDHTHHRDHDHHDHDGHAHEGHAHHDEATTTWLAHLFAGHGEGAECRLFDALGSGDGAVQSPPDLLATALPDYWLVFYAGQALARWAALYQARGPPSPR